MMHWRGFPVQLRIFHPVRYRLCTMQLPRPQLGPGGCLRQQMLSKCAAALLETQLQCRPTWRLPWLMAPWKQT